MNSPTQSSNSSDAIFDLVSFLVSSARGAPEEGVYTASLRLIHAAGRLSRLDAAEGTDVFLAHLGESIAAKGSSSYLESTESYLAFLDDTLESVAREVRRRNGLPPAQARGAADDLVDDFANEL